MSANVLPIAIAGIGESRVGRVPDRTTLQLQTDATMAALEDAGLQLFDIDGLLTTPVRVEQWGMPCGVVASHLGIRPKFLSTVDLAGASGCAMIHQAALAIASGQADTMLCVAGQNLLSNRSRADAVKSMAEGGTAHPQFEVPYVGERQREDRGDHHAHAADVQAVVERLAHQREVEERLEMRQREAAIAGECGVNDGEDRDHQEDEQEQRDDERERGLGEGEAPGQYRNRR